MKKYLVIVVLTVLSASITGCALKDKISSIFGSEEYVDIYHQPEPMISLSDKGNSRKIVSEDGVVSYRVSEGDGKYYTVRETDPTFEHYKTEEDISLIDVSNKIDTDYISYYLTRNAMTKEYIKIDLPNKYEYYVTDNSIYVPTGEIKISLYDGNVGEDLDAGNSVVYDKDTKYTKDGGNNSHIIIKEFEDKFTIRAEVNSNSEDWSMVVSSVIEMTEELSYPEYEITFENNMPEYDTSEIKQSIYLTNDYFRTAKFEDGYLNITNSAYNRSSNIDVIRAWIFTRNINEHTPYREYSDDNIYIMWTDDGYCASTFSNNKDFKFVLYGYGKEALINMMEIIRNETK